MKSYTDIEQSKKLAEILPLESADGFWEFHTEWGEFEDITAVIDVSNLKLIEYHREHYIFNSYEEALGWSIKNPDKGIQWHSKILYWDEHKKKFKSYEPEPDLDGIVRYGGAIRYYTKEELLKGTQEYIWHR